MKLVLAGLWVALVALGTAYGVALYLPGGSDTKVAAAVPVLLQSQKTRVINVPMDTNVLKTLQVPPDVYLLDEAFRAIYSDPALDPRHLEKYDLQKLTARLVKGTNDRLGAPLIKDVLIENFAYIDKDAAKG